MAEFERKVGVPKRAVGASMRAWCFGLCWAALVLSLSACPDDDCTPSLEEWCGEGGCDARPNLDEALAQLLKREGILDTSQLCGERAIVNFSGGFGGSTFVYDTTNGRLVGGSDFSDQLTHDECANQMKSAGEPATCRADACDLIAKSYTTDSPVEACQGALAEPFIAACLAEPPAAIAGCEQCACESCYPTLLSWRGDGPGIPPAAVDCLNDHCPDDCSAQLEAIE